MSIPFDVSNATLFRVKICGLRTPADAAAVTAAGGDAVGLNFYASSPRYVDWANARTIAAMLPANVLKVGLFVNAPADEVRRACADVPLDVVQLHGDESPEYVAQLAGRRVLKAFRTDAEVVARVLDYVAACAAQGTPLAGVLVDAFHAGSYGGTGKQADWPAARELRSQLGSVPLILAGGLKPENVAAAIAAVGPYGVDTASGVETAPGVKDAALIEQFIAAARTALREES